MYNSQYYTCEQIDQRLLQGYLDDYNSQNNTNLTKEQFLTLLFNTIGRNSTVDNLVTQIGYYECDTAGATAAKAITVANYALFAGGSMKVKFINKNTANNATLNINNKGAKALYYQGERASATNSWDVNEVVEIYYDGTSYYANNVKGGSGSGVYDVSVEHPTSGPNEDGKFTIEYILNPSNVNELIPVNKRYPGMSIQFVSTYDNKYIQARCMPDEFTTDTTQWAIAEEGVYVENPEFVYVKTGKDDRILWAIKTDGGIYYGAGVPQQVIDYIDERLADLSLDEYEDIVAFLDDLEKGDKTLQTLLNEKVDKEEGKSLIDADYASTKSTIDNPEFLEVTLDTEDKVLEGIQQDGTKVIGGNLNVEGSAIINGDTKILGNMEVSGVSYKVVENPEYLAAWVDAENKVVFGLKTDGKTYVGDADFLNDIEDIKSFIQDATDKYIDWDALSSITAVENPELIEAKTDSEGKLLAGRTPDGAAFENVGFSAPKVSVETVNIDGHTIENIEDPEERMEILTDKDGRILSYRKKDGTKVEKSLEVENLTIQNPSAFIAQMRAQGYDIAATDYSEAKELHIPEPRCARVNFTGIPDIPQAKFLDYKGYMEFWDMQGNYFKKEVIMNAQGRSTMGDAKKNIAIDICNNNGWDDDDTFKLQIGDWVPQDSFHLKAYMKDPFKCLGPISYAFHNEVVKTRGILRDYVWKRALIDTDAITETSTGVSDEESKMQYTNGATCFPQCFPCIVYLNGEFYGIYSWQIKKHRDNYQMSKKEAKHVHLDNNVSNRLLYANGDASLINWNALDVYNQGLEIRNPKNLYLMDGSKYDEDFNPGELIDETSPYYDPTNKDHVRSAKVKKYILDLSKVLPAMDAMATISTNNGDIKLKNYQGVYNTTDNFSKGVWVSDGNGSYYMSLHSTNTGNPLSDTNNWIEVTQAVADVKQSLEEHWDIDNLIDYEIVSDIICNVDGFGDNWQWVTYDGVKWYICIYDTDMTFGYHQGSIITPRTVHLMTTLQYEYLLNFYQDELDKRYAELRKLGLIDADHIIKLFEDWMNRLGNKDAYEKEWEKWPTPFFNDSTMRVYKWLKETIENMDTVYNYNI